MNKLHHVWPVIALAVLLAACVDPPLDQRLAGKTGGERASEAYDACLEYAQFSGVSRTQKRELGALCRAMDSANRKEQHHE